MTIPLTSDIVRDVLARPDEDLPEGAKDLVSGVFMAQVQQRAERRRSVYFLADWNRDPSTNR